jgi:DEAD/DEAH box helicase domain-containing protein
VRDAIPAVYAEPATPLHPQVVARLEASGAGHLWRHQAQAVDLLRAGRSVVVATGTASGKTLCYQLPIVDAIVRGEPATALLVYPTKALAKDQLRRFREWLVPDLVAATYDGDTAPDDRARLRKQANVVLTNPEMLHVGMLPFHERWATFLMRLRYVVIDELHALRGIFGGHVAHVLRRLRRLCEHYGSNPTFCFSSATIGNPGPLASALAGMPIEAVVDDGAPTGPRGFACWQRPLVDPHSGTRASANAETAAILARFVGSGHQTLAFTRSRKGAEVVAANARALLDDAARDSGSTPPRVAAYRAGYLPAERRELEDALTTGALGGIVATSALELGIDVGGLDAIVVNGFPGTLASFRQQIGRAGRGNRGAATVLVAGDDQLDQWYAANPRALLERPAEAAIANPDNPFVLAAQVGCAAHELPIEPSDERWFGPGLDDAVRELVLADLLKPRDGRMYWSGRRPPAPTVGLRNGSGTEYELVDQSGETIGTVDAGRVFQVVHPGAVYLHQGRQYRVTGLEPEHHRAILEPADDLDEYTRTREATDLTIVASEQTTVVGRGSVSLGAVEVTTRVTGYQRKRVSTNVTIEVVPLDVPPSKLATRACWYTVPLPVIVNAGLAPGRILGAVHAAEHALIGLLPLFAICDRWDVGGVSIASHPATEEPSIFVYDGYAGGAGIAELAFARVDEHVRAARELVAACPCDAGCPSCVQSPKCGNWNEYLDKAGAVTLLDLLTAAAN